MVGAAEEIQLDRLENQVEHGGGGAWEYLCLVRELKVRRPEKVLKYGLAILNNPKKRSKVAGEEPNWVPSQKLSELQDEERRFWENKEWTLYEQVALAALDCQRLDVAKDCIGTLQKKFPGSLRIGRLEGMFLEAKGSWADAEKAYSRLLEENPLDQVIRKRKIAMEKAKGNIPSAIELLNKYLETFMADHEAWRELAELYVSLQMYKQAAFCYEELILCQPTIPLHHLAYADVLYTLGSLENLQAAKKYYSSTIDLSGGKNIRALYGVCLCSIAINQLSKGRNKEEKGSPDLHSLAAKALVKDYKQRAPTKVSLLTSTLQNMKLLS